MSSRTRQVSAALLLILAATAAAVTVAASPQPGGPAGRLIPWAVDPEDPGEDLPPAGRSLFDFLVASKGGYDVPFPFSALVQAIGERLGGTPFERVLIPLGRSLQRNAAAPRFFHAPRAILAVVEDPGRPGAPLLKDRLYLGYQETAAILEVISYNEAAGRFEFQVVHDYRPGGRPRVLYASRALCTACHQNAAPIFARQLWDETNANPRIARLLRDEGRGFYGFPVDLGPDSPYAIQAAAERANRFALDLRLWREGCDIGERAPWCRAALFKAALQYRLTGGRFAPFAEPVGERFPQGLAVSDPLLPNRDPFAGSAAGPRQVSVPGSLTPEASALLGGLVMHSVIPAPFEPLNPRPPLQTWKPGGGLERLVAGLAAFLAERDVRDLDARLFNSGSALEAPRRTLAADCRLAARRSASGKVDRLKLDCRGGFGLQGRIYLAAGRVTGGEIERVMIDGAVELSDLAVQGEAATGLTLVRKGSGFRARRPGGDAVERLDLSWSDTGADTLEGHAELTFLSDFAAVNEAVEALARSTAAGESDALADRPFRRAVLVPALLAKLGGPASVHCCTDTAGMPPVALDTLGGAAPFPEPALRAFFRYCSTCHATDQPSPPNFLYGEPAQVRAQLAQCAERIYFRLGMWQLPMDDRAKTAMPPVHALRRLHLEPGDWPDHPDLHLLRRHAADRLRAETGAPPRIEELTARGYENLRECMGDSVTANQAP